MRIDLIAFTGILALGAGCSAPSDTDGKDSTDSGDAWLPCSDAPFESVAVGVEVVTATRADGCIEVGSWRPPAGWESETGVYSYVGSWVDHGLATPPTGSYASVALSLGCAYRNVDMPELCDPEYGACALGLDGVPVCWSQPYDEGSYPLPNVALTKVAPGFRHACGLREDGGIECWGECLNDSCAAPEGAYTDLTSGHDFTCALDTAGVATCWGEDPDASQSYWTDAEKAEWRALVVDWGSHGPYVRLISSTELVCGILDSGDIRCRFYAGYGLDDDFEISDVPLRGATPILSATAEWVVTACGLDEEGKVVCGEGADQFVPVDVLADYTFTGLSSGPFRLCGLTTSGEIVCAVNARDVAVCPFCTEILVDL